MIFPKALRDANAVVGGKKTTTASSMMQTIKENQNMKKTKFLQ